jgi:hypothetical protein
MPKTALTVRSRRLLDLAVAPAGETWFTFAQADEDTGLATTVLKMSEQSWLNLGSPAQLTVTIEPGDQLNA